MNANRLIRYFIALVNIYAERGNLIIGLEMNIQPQKVIYATANLAISLRSLPTIFIIPRDEFRR